MKKTEKKAQSIYGRSDYKDLKAFNDALLDEKSPLGKLISSESLRLSSENIQKAIVTTIVNNGHGVMLQQVS